jgi:Xaa-Pro aminopeptidase
MPQGCRQTDGVRVKILPSLLALGLLTAGVTAQDRRIPLTEYQSRRAALVKAMGPDALFVAFSAVPTVRTGDIDWPFRQEDNLLYLTGLNEPDTTLVLLPGERGHEERIFAADSDPLKERWTGHIPSSGEVSAVTGVAEVLSAGRLARFVDALFQGNAFGNPSLSARYYDPPVAPAFLAAFRAGRAEVWLLLQNRGSVGALTREQQFADDLRHRYPEIRVRDASPMLRAMREIKSETELALIQRAVDITVAAQKAAMARVLTATRESEVHATIEFTFRNLGACCWAFPSIVAAGRNATTLHYETNNGPISRDGLLLTDIGAEVEGYSADVTRTYPASGRFSAEQRAIYEAVYAAQNETFPLMRSGNQLVDMYNKAHEVVGRELLKLGLVTKNVREQSGLYLFHPTGHPLGLQTHDVDDRAHSFEFRSNMVYTNEPGIYVRKQDVVASDVFRKLSETEQQSVRAALDRYDGIGVRIEDDVLITTTEPKILSAAAPRSSADIEALMRRNAGRTP